MGRLDSVVGYCQKGNMSGPAAGLYPWIYGIHFLLLPPRLHFACIELHGVQCGQF
jgi:hypothetical protein